MKNHSLIIGVTGSIAAYKACDVVRSLQQQGNTVDVIMTKEAEAFITPLTFQSLANGKVHGDMFKALAPIEYDTEHIALAKKAQVILVAPATANIIGKLANGIYDDLLTCVVAASKAPVIIAPAMNNGMYNNAIVQENIKKLKRCGMHFIGPRRGKLACGDIGIGCLEKAEVIVRYISKVFRDL